MNSRSTRTLVLTGDREDHFVSKRSQRGIDGDYLVIVRLRDLAGPSDAYYHKEHMITRIIKSIWTDLQETRKARMYLPHSPGTKKSPTIQQTVSVLYYDRPSPWKDMSGKQVYPSD